MRDKSLILRNFNMRAVKAGVFSVLCRWRPVRDYLNYHRDAIAVAEIAVPGSLHSISICPVSDYNLEFRAAELRDVLKTTASEMAASTLNFTMARLSDVSVLGSSGVTVDNASGRVVSLATADRAVPRNWLVARALRSVEDDPSTVYLNLLGVRKGHRHFAHFFWDTMVPLMVYLKNWHDPAEPIICLVREDLSPIQRDAFRFLAEDHAGISFQTLGAGEKMHCRNSIYLGYRNRNHGRDNTLARDYIRMVAALFLQHYGIGQASAGEGRRVYVSRSDAVLRRVTNETEVIAMLRPLGFEVYATGRMPFDEQARLFAAADVIVTPHGAGLANLMFCSPGTKVLEFFPSNYIDDGFARLSRSLGLDYHYLIGGKGNVPKLSYDIDIGRLERGVRAMMGRKATAVAAADESAR